MRNKSRKGGLKLIVILAALVLIFFSGANFALKTFYPLKYSQEIEYWAKEYNLEPSLVYGIVHTESRFRPNAVSSIGARGMMQITEETFEWAAWRLKDDETTYEQLFDAETNLKYGCYIFSVLLQEFKGEKEALAAYHAGWGSVKRWLDQTDYSDDGVTLHTIPFKDTSNYVPTVLKAQEMYEMLYNK